MLIRIDAARTRGGGNISLFSFLQCLTNEPDERAVRAVG